MDTRTGQRLADRGRDSLDIDKIHAIEYNVVAKV